VCTAHLNPQGLLKELSFSGTTGWQDSTGSVHGNASTILREAVIQQTGHHGGFTLELAPALHDSLILSFETIFKERAEQAARISALEERRGVIEPAHHSVRSAACSPLFTRTRTCHG